MKNIITTISKVWIFILIEIGSEGNTKKKRVNT